MSEVAPPAGSGAHAGAARTLRLAAAGATGAFATLVVVCQALALAHSLLVGVVGLGSWVKVGLLTALVSVRAEVEATVHGSPFLPGPGRSATLQWRLVPLLLTIGFVWLACRAGRRAARERPGRAVLATVGLAAAGAAPPGAILAGLASSLARLSLPDLGLTVGVDATSAALWAGALAAAGAATGAALEAAPDRVAVRALRGGIGAYGAALGLAAVLVVVVATLEPAVTRSYVDGLGRLGASGAALFGYHLLAFPAQSALLMAPAAGSCLEVVTDGPALSLCPWSLATSGPAGPLALPGRLGLSPWLWLLNAVPLASAVVGGRRTASGPDDPGAVGRVAIGTLSGVVFAALAVGTAWFVAPRWFVPAPVPIPVASVHPGWLEMSLAVLAWGLAGGALGGLWVGQRYDVERPSPTSA